jgi:CRISPR-associated protein Csc2
MPFLKTVKESNFLTAIPPKPQGLYAHFLILRVTESYALFQTDGELNTARVSAGIEETKIIPRLVMFKRKQSTPERLTGRALLRNYGVYDAIAEKRKETKKKSDRIDVCDYNVDFCKRCPDCIIYGFAIGDSGSEKSKVVTDTAFSLTPFDASHETFTLNAPYEDGTMSREGETTSRINSQDHITPQVYFPSVVTLKDPTEAGFLYVLNNLQRTKRYGAQTTRTGRVKNIVLGVAFADGEITSNLRLTQATFDRLRKQDRAIDGVSPLPENEVREALDDVLPELLKAEGVAFRQTLLKDEWERTHEETQRLFTDETSLKSVLEQASRESNAYADRYIVKGKSS